MRKAWIFPSLAAAAGLLAGVLRAFENQYVLDPQTGLRASGHPLTLLTLLVCALAAAAAAIPAARNRTESDAVSVLSGSRAFQACAWVSAAALLAGALFSLIRFAGDGKLSALVFAGLSAFSAVSVVAVSAAARRPEPKGGSVFAVVPVFWACFWLILTYGEHAADPVVPDYLYTLVGESAAVVALYLLAALAFDRKRIGSAAVFALLSVLFSVLNLSEPLLCLLLFQNDSLMADLISYRLYFLFPLILMFPVSARLIEKMRAK